MLMVALGQHEFDTPFAQSCSVCLNIGSAVSSDHLEFVQTAPAKTTVG
jgi:hypothetical protein